MTYRIHRRMMGWKLTSPKMRREIIHALDGLSVTKPPLSELQTASLAHLSQRQAGAVFQHARRMMASRDLTPAGAFKKLQRDKRQLNGEIPRGGGRLDAVQSRLLQTTDRAGLHRAILEGISAMENEPFIAAARAKSRERSRGASRGGSGGRSTPGWGADGARTGSASAALFGLQVGVGGGAGGSISSSSEVDAASIAMAMAMAGTNRPLSPATEGEIRRNQVAAPLVSGIPPSAIEHGEYQSISLSQLGLSSEWDNERYERPIDKSKWGNFGGLKAELEGDARRSKEKE
jgi:hypothetical protein